MFKRLIAGLCALTALSLPVFAANTCEPAKLVAAVDTYTNDPFGPRAWRMMKGLGDPGIEADYGYDNSWEQSDAWKKLIAQFPAAGKYAADPGYDCRVGYPLTVLQDRTSHMGRESKYVQQWLRVQDVVMQACTEQGGALALPDPMEIHPALAKLQQDDRAYQEASIAFYRDRARAITLFKAIGASDSPHRAAARYNIANLLANAKDVKGARAEADAILKDPSLASVHAITKELLGYIANIEDTAEGWNSLLTGTMAVIEQPKDTILASAESQRQYGLALYDIDHAGVDAKNDDWWLDGKLPENPTLSKALVDHARNNPGVLWMIAGKSASQYYDSAPWSVIGDKWQKRLNEMMGKALGTPAAKDLKWPARDLLAAMAAAPDEAGNLWTQAKLAAVSANASCGANPETAAAGVLLAQATRASAMAGKFDDIYANLATVPFKGTQAYAEKTVLKLGEYLMGQGNVKEARRYRDTLLTPEFFSNLPENGREGLTDRFAELMLWMAEDEAHWKQALSTYGHKTSNQVLNFLPAKSLRALADDPMFNADQKALLSRAAWTRDYVLGRKISADDTAKMMSLNPALKTLADKTAADYPKASPDHAQLLTILRSPRYGILITSPDVYDGIDMQRDDFNQIDDYDPNDKNWWCPLETDRQLGALRGQFDDASGLTYVTGDYSPSWLGSVVDPELINGLAAKRDQVLKAHPMIKTVSWKEIAGLAGAASGPKKLSTEAIRWGKASKGDDGAPEALALAVRTTRYGCRWHGSHAAYSKGAQELLKAKFGDTSFAKQTPYWFGCMWQVWDKDYNKVPECKPKTWPKQAPLH